MGLEQFISAASRKTKKKLLIIKEIKMIKEKYSHDYRRA